MVNGISIEVQTQCTVRIHYVHDLLPGTSIVEDSSKSVFYRQL